MALCVAIYNPEKSAMAKTTRKAKGTGKGNSVANAEARNADVAERGVNKYDPKFCGVVVRMGSAGASEHKMAVHGCGVARSTMRLWATKHPEFKDALALANDAAQCYWEDKGHNALNKRGFNAFIWSKIISSRFRGTYAERMEVAGDEEKPLNHVHTIRRVIVKAGEKVPK